MNTTVTQLDTEAPAWELDILARDPVVVHTNWTGQHLPPDKHGVMRMDPVDPSRAAGELWVDKVGTVTGAHSKLHRAQSGSRFCVHSLKEPAPAEFFGAQWTRDLRWQPVLYHLGASPVIASRNEGIVTLSFDCIGPVAHCKLRPGRLSDAHQFKYRMHRIIFDDKPDEVDPGFWLGMWVD